MSLDIEKIKTEIRTVVSYIDWTHISHTFKESNSKSIVKVESIQLYKLAELRGSKMQHDPRKVIHNLSTYQLSSVEERLLCKGLDYSLPPGKVKFENHLLPFELLYRDVYDVNDKSESLLHLKCKIKDIGLSSF